MSLMDDINKLRKELGRYEHNQEAILIHPADRDSFGIGPDGKVQGLLLYTETWMRPGQVMLGSRESIEAMIERLRENRGGDSLGAIVDDVNLEQMIARFRKQWAASNLAEQDGLESMVEKLREVWQIAHPPTQENDR